MTTTQPRNPSLNPVKVTRVRVVHGGAGGVTRVTAAVKVTLRNGTDVRCDHTHGHKTNKAFVDCATALVARLNRAAGTTTAAVEAEKAAKKAQA